MLISSAIYDKSAGVELVRTGDVITLNLATVGDDDVIGIINTQYSYGSIRYSFDGKSDFVEQTLYDDIVFLQTTVSATLSADTPALGDFTIVGSVDVNSKFSVVLFDTATTYTGTSGIDYIFGSAFADRLSGGAGDDGIEAGAGDDVLIGGAGADLLDGGDGNDTASYTTSAQGVVANLATGVGSGGDAAGDRYISIENLAGSAHNDTLVGDSGANVLNGGAGDDVLRGLGGDDRLFGGAGDDILMGGSGRDFLDGGPGQDTASYADATAGVRVNLARPSINTGDAAGDVFVSIENLTGSSYDDLLIGDAGANVISGGAGNDVIAGRGGADTLSGGSGYNTFVFDTPVELNGTAATISDYSVAFDRIRLKPSVFTALTPGLSLADNEFHLGATATSSEQRILYDAQTGTIAYDPDGSGAASAIVFARVTPGLAMSASEFAVL